MRETLTRTRSGFERDDGRLVTSMTGSAGTLGSISRTSQVEFRASLKSIYPPSTATAAFIA